MTDLIVLAREAGAIATPVHDSRHIIEFDTASIQAFTDLIRKDERENYEKLRNALICAKELAELLSEYDECDLLALDQDPHPPSAISVHLEALNHTLNAACVREAIRARTTT